MALVTEKVAGQAIPGGVPQLSRVRRLIDLARRFTGNRLHLLVVGATLLVFAGAFAFAYLLRFEFSIPDAETEFMLRVLPLVLLVKLITFYVCRVYRILWAYVGIWDLFRILRASVLASGGLLAVVFFLVRAASMPRSVIVLDGVLTFLGIGGIYALLRFLREVDGRTVIAKEVAEPVIIVGAGDAGEGLLRELQRNRSAGARVIGFLDDAPEKQKQSLRGTPILGRIDQVREIAYRHGVRKAYIAIPSASGMVLKGIVGHLLAAGLAVKILPRITQLSTDDNLVPRLREISIEDLLRRDPIRLDDGAISDFIRGKIVLVTGAAGSIGSELCRQILQYGPRRLVALDCAETPLHDLVLELHSKDSDSVAPELADVTDSQRVGAVFEAHRPEVVFHAAALKHVPLLEKHPREAIRVNVKGTRIITDAVRRFNSGTFVLISTDKAVNPTSVMGATKRIAEMLTWHLAGAEGRTRYMAVRFGNVLGSSGSVLQIFKSQLAVGGPLTVTHPEMRRYFMTIPEAVQLVLQASVLGQGREVFVLDMGPPVKIVDLAEDLIRLSGRIPGVDVKIEFTGIRPGEKLFEEIKLNSETVQPTAHPQIFSLLLSRAHAGEPAMLEALEKLADSAGVDSGNIARELRTAVSGASPG